MPLEGGGAEPDRARWARSRPTDTTRHLREAVRKKLVGHAVPGAEGLTEPVILSDPWGKKQGHLQDLFSLKPRGGESTRRVLGTAHMIKWT